MVRTDATKPLGKLELPDRTGDAFMKTRNAFQKHPLCAICRRPMWLAGVETNGPNYNKLNFECPVCGTTVVERTSSVESETSRKMA